MKKKSISPLVILFLIMLVTVSCSRFQQVMKSNDMDKKYEAAVGYYNKKDYYHALQLFEELMSVFRGTNKAEMSLYYYSYCTYYIDDYQTAAYHFSNFVQTYPNSVKAEEMQYMYAQCFYLDSPISSLDQTSTMEAINKFQIFINRYPESERVTEANSRIDELRYKLESKAFANAKQYYHTENYKAAITSFENFLKDYPSSTYLEDSYYLLLRSSWLLAQNSVPSKRQERLKTASENYFRLIDNFPQSQYLRDSEKIYEGIKKELNS